MIIIVYTGISLRYIAMAALDLEKCVLSSSGLNPRHGLPMMSTVDLRAVFIFVLVIGNNLLFRTTDQI